MEAIKDNDIGALNVLLAGNPNSGKTSLFNTLTGSRQRVGNYPGITVEKKEGRYRHGERTVNVLDLPGAYSLTSYSPEERVARRELLRDKVDVVVVVVDATNLERNLYLLLQVMELGANPVLALNMSDEAARSGQRLDVPAMRSLLGVPIVETVAHRGEGLTELQDAIEFAAAHPTHGERFMFSPTLETAIDRVAARIRPTLPLASPPARWVAIKLLERDPDLRGWYAEHAQDALANLQQVEREIHHLEAAHEQDAAMQIADGRYAFIAGLLREVRLSGMRQDARRRSEAVDAVLVHRVLGLPIFLAIMYLLFWLTFTLGQAPMDWLNAAFQALAGWVDSFWPAGSPSTLRSLLVDGVIGGVGGVLVFLPNIVFLFLGLSLLEDTGYLARIAFLVDRFMHKFGLHGKSFVPLLTGFGCSIPGILATRTLENERDRLTTMLVLPLMSCGARLPIYLLIIPAFFARPWQAPMLWLIYLIGVVLAVSLARLLRSTILAGEDAPFVMELPPYRLPTPRAVLTRTLERAWMYLRKAGTLILAISILLWLAGSYPKPSEADRAARPDVPAATLNLEHSLAGRIGHALEPVTRTMGADYRVATAMIGAFASKEVFVAQLGIVFSLGPADEHSVSLRHKLRETYTPLQAFAILLFLLVATPCMATVAVIRRESGSWKWALLQFVGLTVAGWLLATLVYQLGRLLA